MTVIVTKDAINLREKLSELDKETGIKGEEIMRADTSAEAREALQLDQQLFTDFESTGIDDNATSTAMTINSSNKVGIGTSSGFAKVTALVDSNYSVVYDDLSGSGFHISTNGTAANGAYGGALTFGRIDGSVNRQEAAIAAVQTESDLDRVGLAFFHS